TRFSRDWSSDVCSSDLNERTGVELGHNCAGLVRGECVLSDGWRRTATTAANGGDVDGLFIKIFELKVMFGGRSSADGAKIVRGQIGRASCRERVMVGGE